MNLQDFNRIIHLLGIAIAVDKTTYISDERNIRVITPDGKIRTLIGNHGRVTGPPRPIPCLQRNGGPSETLLAGEMQLQWPTRLAINPLDSTLYIVDDTLILRLTPDMRIQAVAGVSPLCPSMKTDPIKDYSKANRSPLGPIADIQFSFDGKLVYMFRWKFGTSTHLSAIRTPERMLGAVWP